MPLPKLPSRPAAILTFPSGEAARTSTRSKKTTPPPSSAPVEAINDQSVQPELEGLKSQAIAQAAVRSAASGRSETIDYSL